jgi:hypothetical protein
MASQLRKVTGNRRLTSDPRAILQAKIANLPRRMQQQQQREIIKRDTAFQGSQIALQKDAATQRKREQEAAMGLEAGKLGVNIGMSDLGKKTMGDMVGGAKNISNDTMNTSLDPKSPGMPAGIRDFNVGGAISSGLTGYGVGKLVGGRKGKKTGYGAGAGALMGMLSSNSGQGLSGMIGGGIAGAIGGYFS